VLEESHLILFYCFYVLFFLFISQFHHFTFVLLFSCIFTNYYFFTFVFVFFDSSSFLFLSARCPGSSLLMILGNRVNTG